MKKEKIYLLVGIVGIGVVGLLFFFQQQVQKNVSEGVGTPSSQEELVYDEEGNRILLITARQWEFEPSEIRMKVGETAIVTVVNEDVAHGFAIPLLGLDEPLPPNSSTNFTFTADKKGTFPIVCSIYCGIDHGGMTGVLIVE